MSSQNKSNTLSIISIVFSAISVVLPLLFICSFILSIVAIFKKEGAIAFIAVGLSILLAGLGFLFGIMLTEELGLEFIRTR